MTIHLLTLFPEMFKGPFSQSIVDRAQKKSLVGIKVHNLRQWAIDARGTVDGRPYGGGVGMVLRPEPIFAAVNEIKKTLTGQTKIILTTPRGKKYTQATARKLSRIDNLIIICGHYEGYDERITTVVDEQISIGSYILTGGEIPAMVIIDSVVRLIPGVLTKPEAIEKESFTKRGVLEHPQYTRPEVFAGLRVPEILLSGNHGEVDRWRTTAKRG